MIRLCIQCDDYRKHLQLASLNMSVCTTLEIDFFSSIDLLPNENWPALTCLSLSRTQFKYIPQDLFENHPRLCEISLSRTFICGAIQEPLSVATLRSYLFSNATKLVDIVPLGTNLCLTHFEILDSDIDVPLPFSNEQCSADLLNDIPNLTFLKCRINPPFSWKSLTPKLSKLKSLHVVIDVHPSFEHKIEHINDIIHNLTELEFLTIDTTGLDNWIQLLSTRIIDMKSLVYVDFPVPGPGGSFKRMTRLDILHWHYSFVPLVVDNLSDDELEMTRRGNE